VDKTGRKQDKPSLETGQRLDKGGGQRVDSVQDGVDIKTAAEQLELSEEAVRKRIKRGTLDAYKVDGKWFIRMDKLPDSVQDTSSQPDNTQGLQELVEARQQAAAAELRAAVAEEAVRRLEAERENHLQQISALQVALDQQQRLHAALQQERLMLPTPRQGLMARVRAMLSRDKNS
jgi:hypothetical protein